MRLSVVACTSALLMTVSSAFADQPAYFDAEAAMTAGSNMALVRGGGAAWSNPAGLHTSENNQFDLTVSAFVLRVRDFSRVFRAELPSGTYFPEAEEVTIQPIPSALVYERRLTKDVTAALAILVTAADTMDLTGDLQRTETFSNTPEPVELSARADISSQSQTYRIGPGVSWEISPRVRLGLSTFLVYSSFRDSSVLRLVAKSSAGTAEALGSSRRRISGFGGQMALGAQWELGGGVVAGTTLRTPVIGFGQTGSLTSETSILSSAGAFPGEQVATTLRPDVPITAGLLSEPAQFVAGLAFKQPTWWLGAEVEVTPPLVRPELGINEGPEANVRVGGRIWIADAYSLGLGAFTDRDATTSTVRTGEAVVDYYGGATGFEWRSKYSVNDGGETRPLVFSTTVALRYALGIGDLESLVFSPSAATLSEFSRVRPASERVYFHALTVQLGSSLAF